MFGIFFGGMAARRVPIAQANNSVSLYPGAALLAFGGAFHRLVGDALHRRRSGAGLP